MSFLETVDQKLRSISQWSERSKEWLERFQLEVDFASRLAQAHPDRQSEWEGLITQALEYVERELSKGASPQEVVTQAENLLAPLSKAAKEYTVHCVGHAHIDMNWMWGWPETVATTYDTFLTVDRLMEEFPEFRFSQSQVSIYQLVKDYLPELWERIKQRIREGRWEVTANHWVEGDKNLASGETLCRHLLYTKRFFKEELGIPYDTVKIDWEPDTFGHSHTLPTLLAQAGVKYYYFCRAGQGQKLFWWQGKDGSRVLAFDDSILWYNGAITHDLTRLIFDFEKETGLKEYLFVFGVGDHGGGPTRRDLETALKMNSWPLYPRVKLSTVQEFFQIAEAKAKNLPVVDSELNFVFEGCYTSQSRIKYANRKSENALVEAEMYALLARGIAGLSYPSLALHTAWKYALFNQFHDILPGSGVPATRDYALGLFQEILTHTSMIKTRSLRSIASQVDTSASCLCEETPETISPPRVGPGIGAGPGDLPADGAVTRWSAGEVSCDPFVVFNPSPWERSEVVTARIWDRPYPNDQIIVKDDQGRAFPAQVIQRGHYWGHSFIEVAFPAHQVSGLGYRNYSIGRSPLPRKAKGCEGDGRGRIENEFFLVEIDQGSGAIRHLIDKKTGIDFVPPGEQTGFLEYLLEAPHGMTAWVIGQIIRTVPFLEGAVLDFPQRGPYLATIRASHRFNQSRFALSISLATGVPRVDFALEADWLERGDPESGVPSLKVVFPLALQEGKATFECPNGYVERPTDPRQLTTYTWKWSPPQGIAVPEGPPDVPAQKWVDLTGKHPSTSEPVGVTLLNDSKYGHSVRGSTLCLSLLRSSYDPDPLPELGHHSIRFALRPHIGEWTPAHSARAGFDFNLPFNVVSTTTQKGTLPPRKGFVQILTSNVMLSGMKKAEDSDALVLRLYEVEGKPTRAQVQLDEILASPKASAVETDLLEQPLSQNTAKLEGGILSVDIPAFGTVTVLIR